MLRWRMGGGTESFAGDCAAENGWRNGKFRRRVFVIERFRRERGCRCFVRIRHHWLWDWFRDCAVESSCRNLKFLKPFEEVVVLTGGGGWLRAEVGFLGIGFFLKKWWREERSSLCRPTTAALLSGVINGVVLAVDGGEATGFVRFGERWWWRNVCFNLIWNVKLYFDYFTHDINIFVYVMNKK